MVYLKVKIIDQIVRAIKAEMWIKIVFEMLETKLQIPN